MAKKETTLSTFSVIGGLCFVCSILVCVSVVLLKPLQEIAINNDRQISILEAASVKVDGKVSEVYANNIEERLVDLKTGEYVTDKNQLASILGSAEAEIGSYDFVANAKVVGKNIDIDASKDKDNPGIKTTAAYMPVYLVKNGATYSAIILPFYGQGLWSTMYGYLSVDVDGNTIKAVKFYSHGETPGLGAEIENPKWTATWVGKKLFDNTEYMFNIKKNAVANGHEVDALSGATLTSDGVSRSVKFWANESGYGKLLNRIKSEGVK